MSTLDHTLKSEATIRRLEVITGTGRRRRFSTDDKARMRIVEETLAPGRGDVGGCSPAWADPAASVHVASASTASGNERRSDRDTTVCASGCRSFAAGARAARRAAKCSRRVERISGIIEAEIAEVTVRVNRGAGAKTVAAVLRALKGGA